MGPSLSPREDAGGEVKIYRLYRLPQALSVYVPHG